MGKPLKIDLNIPNVALGKFARFCLEIDFVQLVVGKECLDCQWYKLEYKGLHIICASCGCYGYYSKNCSKHVATGGVNLGVNGKSGSGATNDGGRWKRGFS